MVLATDSHGNALVEVALGESPDTTTTAPLTGALVVVTGPDGVLLVHDRWRDQWEVPGGGIDAGESPKEAAAREVAEESGQRVTVLRWVGRATFLIAADGHLAQADLFRGEVEGAAPFEPNAEIAGVRWWDGVSPLADLSAVDAELVRRVLDQDDQRPTR